MAAPDILFKGIPRGPTRAYTADVIQATAPRLVVIPCTGSFSLAHVAVQAGIPPSAIVCGDISIYSTALGNAIQDTDWRLALTEHAGDIGHAVAAWLDTPMRKAVAVLYAIRVCQYDGDKQHKADHRTELLCNADHYLNQLHERVQAVAQTLGGLTYHPRDMWDTLEAHRHDPDTLILANPPRYSKGYQRMFKGIDQIFTWDEPDAAQFDESDYERLMELLGRSPAHTLMYYATPGEDPTPLWGDPWRAVFADRPGSLRRAAVNWIIANRAPLPATINRARMVSGKGVYPLFDGTVQSDSLLVAQQIKKETGDYYRDLFIHKIDSSGTERYVGLFLDGALLAVVGLHLKTLRTGGGTHQHANQDAANMTFAFSVPHPAYARLHKLTLLSVVSAWFWQDAFGHEQWYVACGAPENVQTTMLTEHPENKTARGILKLDRREPQKTGGYKLSYSAAIVARTREETIGIWLKKWAPQTRA
jgi:hypothetical protein